MKNYTRHFTLLFCALCLTAATTRAQSYVQIPDNYFGDWLYNNGYSGSMTGDFINGYQLDVSSSAVTQALMIDCGNANINDISGIEYFTNLQYLDCSNNNIFGIYALPPSLQSFGCSNNQISFINSLPAGLASLYIGYNPLYTLPTLPSSLTLLNCSGDHLHSLTGLPAGLTDLTCRGNPLTSLGTLPAGLINLDCYGDSLTSLPALPATIQTLDCSFNPLHNLPALPAALGTLTCASDMLHTLPALPSGMVTLVCYQNSLDSLPALPASLSQMLIQRNNLTYLPALPTALYSLLCDDNYLTTLPALPAALRTLSASSNALTSLPALNAGLTNLTVWGNYSLAALPALPASLIELSCYNDNISVMPTLPPQLDKLDCRNNPIYCLPRIYKDTMSTLEVSGGHILCLPNQVSVRNHVGALPPLCTAASGCDFYYNIAGNVHLDTAATCLADSLHPGAQLRQMKVRLKQGGNVIQQFYTFYSGGYSFKTPSLGSYTVDIDTTGLPVLPACPLSAIRSVSLSAVDSVKKYESFGMKCTGADYGVVGISGLRFRPATTTTVSIYSGNMSLLRYNADCGSGVSGTVTVTYTGAATYQGPAAGALTPTVSGHTLTYTVADLDQLQYGSLSFLLAIDSSAALGSSICMTATIAPSVADLHPADNTLTQCFTVVNSYDPNLKEVYPTTLSPDGGWLTYTVHFQNTGNAPAILVVLRDTLSQYFDASTFQYVASSHNAVIQLDHNAMTFTFPHINLPDSASNPAGSQGWIQYKVKANSGLALGTQVRNTVYIYFDANPAIATNTTVNTVRSCTDTTILLSRAICAGDTFAFYGMHLTATGTYNDTMHKSGGCDSIISLTLAVHPAYSIGTYDTICAGSSYTFYGRTLTQAGIYTDSMYTVHGCDSFTVLHLAVRPLPVVTWAQTDTLFCFDDVGSHYLPLTGMSPAGGVFSTSLVHNDTLYPEFHDSILTISYSYTDSNGCTASATKTFIVTLCLGINDIPLSAIRLYPNPNAGSFNLETVNSRGNEYIISDMLGHIVAQAAISSDMQLVDMSDASAGVYTLSVKGSIPIRFVIMR